MKFTGIGWKFGDNIDTDAIIPARYLNTSAPEILAIHCMEDADPGFARKVRNGDIIVAGKNFGCGSSREHAPIAIKAAGISCVIARSFARIFYRNAFNMGLPIFECPDLWELVSEGEALEVDGEAGFITVVNSNTGPLPIHPIPLFMQELIRDGGLIKHLAAKGQSGK
ncbi:MAG: 3-isopropylmalate dehydratase small subunit [Syntrophales bacterium]|nr:3-isopropylmalate dehydratase small subunit [Syntrophales bacterium]